MTMIYPFTRMLGGVCRGASSTKRLLRLLRKLRKINLITCTSFALREVALSIPFCRATQNSTHLLIYTPLNGCGTQVNETQDALIFWNEIRADAVIIDNVITRTHDIRLPFYCHYSRNKMLSLSFKPRNVYFGQEGAVAIPLFFV